MNIRLLKYKKILPQIVVVVTVYIVGLLNYSQNITDINQIPVQILPFLQNVALTKNIDLIKFAGAVKARSDFGRIDLSHIKSDRNIPSDILNLIKVDIFNLQNIYSFKSFNIDRFTFTKENFGIFGFMLLTKEDIDQFGSLNPYDIKDSLSMFADKLISQNYFKSSDNAPHGMPTCCAITMRFMEPYPEDIAKNLIGVAKYHTGIDIADYVGRNTFVRSTLNGIAHTSEDLCGGKYITVTNGIYTTYYGHLDSIKIQDKSKVMIGDIIGIQGNTGLCTTGKHTHYEVRVLNKLVDPLKFI